MMAAAPDFPDWISPMLVKELRQGMRSRVFLLSFLVLQLAMIFLAAIGLWMPPDGGSTQTLSVFFWLIIGAPLLLIMPLSGFNAIAGEKKENTLEPIFLSRLGARRIIAGKWLAIVAQTTLLVSAILPYAVLRYYLGGVDLAENLRVLGWLLLGSTVLTGATVGLSTGTSRVARAFIPVMFFIVFQVFADSAGLRAFGLFGSGSSGPSETLPGILILSALFLMYMLEVGAGRIAPAAENHSTSKRLIALAAISVCLVYTSLVRGSDWLWTIAFLVLVPAGIGAVCEPVREVPSVYRPFVRRGLPGRLAGVLLYPGWASGVFFSLAVLAVLFLAPHGPFSGLLHPPAVPGAHIRMIRGSHHLVRPALASAFPPIFFSAGSVQSFIVVAIIGGFFMPAAVMRVVRLGRLPPVMFYVLFQAGCALLVVLVASIADSSFTAAKVMAAMIPFCGLLLSSPMKAWPEILDFVHRSRSPDRALAGRSFHPDDPTLEADLRPGEGRCRRYRTGPLGRHRNSHPDAAPATSSARDRPPHGGGGGAPAPPLPQPRLEGPRRQLARRGRGQLHRFSGSPAIHARRRPAPPRLAGLRAHRLLHDEDLPGGGEPPR